MEFTDARELCDRDDVAGVKAAAGDNCNAAADLLDEMAKRIEGIGGIWFSGGGENAFGAGCYHIFQRLLKILSFIECAMEGNGQRRGERDEFAGAENVDGCISVHNARRDTLEIFGAEGADFGLHLREFTGGVDEVARAGANEDMNREPDGCSHPADKCETWSEAAGFESCAEFKAMGSGAFGSASTFERGDSNFQENWVRHDDCGRLLALWKDNVARKDKAHGAAEDNVAWEVIAAGDAGKRNGAGESVGDKRRPAMRAVAPRNHRGDGHRRHGVFGVEAAGMKRIVAAVEEAIRVRAVAGIGDGLAAAGDGL